MALETVVVNAIAYSNYTSVDNVVLSSTVLCLDEVMAECADACTSEDQAEKEVEQVPKQTSLLAIAALHLPRRYSHSSNDCRERQGTAGGRRTPCADQG